jgi:hypothetical protein
MPDKFEWLFIFAQHISLICTYFFVPCAAAKSSRSISNQLLWRSRIDIKISCQREWMNLCKIFSSMAVRKFAVLHFPIAFFRHFSLVRKLKNEILKSDKSEWLLFVINLALAYFVHTLWWWRRRVGCRFLFKHSQKNGNLVFTWWNSHNDSNFVLIFQNKVRH